MLHGECRVVHGLCTATCRLLEKVGPEAGDGSRLCQVTSNAVYCGTSEISIPRAWVPWMKNITTSGTHPRAENSEVSKVFPFLKCAVAGNYCRVCFVSSQASAFSDSSSGESVRLVGC